MFEPTIQFRYRFQDVECTGHRIAFGDFGRNDRAEAEKIAERFAPDTLWSVSIRELTLGRGPVLHPGANRELGFAVCFLAFYVTGHLLAR